MAKVAVLAKIRNGALYELLVEKGWSQADLARACGVSPTMAGLWMQMKASPKMAALRARVEAATGRLCADLFPPEIVAVERTTAPRAIAVVREADPQRVLGAFRQALLLETRATGLEAQQMAREVTAAVAQALDRLSAKEQAILRARFGLDGAPQTLGALSQQYGLSANRIHQIEGEALRKLRQPQYMQQLREPLNL